MKTHLTAWSPLLLIALGVSLTGCGGGNELAEGMARLERGDYGTAVRLFRLAAQRSHGAAAYANLGIAYWKMGETDKALEALALAADLHGADPRPHLLMAEVLQDAERWEDARQVLIRIRNGLPERPDILTYLGRLEFKAGQMDLATSYFEAALAIDAQYPPALYNLAVLARDTRAEPIAAMRYFSRYLAAANDQGRIDLVHGELAELRQQLRPAPSLATPVPGASAPASAMVTPSAASPPAAVAAIANATDAPAAARLLGQAQSAVANGAYDEALVLLGQAQTLDPGNADIVWTLAGVYDVQVNQPLKAEATLQAFLAQWPGDPRAASVRRRLNMRTSGGGAVPPVAPTVTTIPSAPAAPPLSAGTTTTTVPPATTVPAVLPGTMGELWPRAVEAHAAGRREEALRYYEAALQLDPEFASAAYNMGIVHKDLGNLEAAMLAFANASRLDPRLTKAHYMLAVTARELGERDTALASAKQVLALNPRDDKATYLLGMIYREAMRYDQARLHFQRALELAPDRAAAAKAREGLNSVSPGRGGR